MKDMSKVGSDEAPGIPPEGKIQLQGQCRYCKQFMLVWAKEGTAQEELDRIAEESCNCPEGEPARQQAYEDAHIERQIIEYDFESDEIRDIVQKLAYAVSHFVIKKASISTEDKKGNEITYSVSKKKGITDIKKSTRIVEQIGYDEE